MARAKCPHCFYSAETEGSLAGHISMIHSLIETDEARNKLRAKAAAVPPTETLLAVERSVSREAWLHQAADLMRPWFLEAGSPIPEAVQISVGWPGGRGKKKGVIGQCWNAALAGDHMPHIFISPVLVEPRSVLSTLAHELCHASVDKGGHRGPFVQLAKAIGFLPPWTATPDGPELKAKLAELAQVLGPYTHGGLSAIGNNRVQTTRMLKVSCPDCGCVIRMTQKWIDQAGYPKCGCGSYMRGW